MTCEKHSHLRTGRLCAHCVLEDLKECYSLLPRSIHFKSKFLEEEPGDDLIDRLLLIAGLVCDLLALAAIIFSGEWGPAIFFSVASLHFFLLRRQV